MKKLMNTLYVTSENSYLVLDGENIVIYDDRKELGRVPLHNLYPKYLFLFVSKYPRLIWISGNQPGAYGSLCGQKHFSLLYDTTGKIPGENHWKSAWKCNSAGATVCQQQR